MKKFINGQFVYAFSQMWDCRKDYGFYKEGILNVRNSCFIKVDFFYLCKKLCLLYFHHHFVFEKTQKS